MVEDMAQTVNLIYDEVVSYQKNLFKLPRNSQFALKQLKKLVYLVISTGPTRRVKRLKKNKRN